MFRPLILFALVSFFCAGVLLLIVSLPVFKTLSLFSLAPISLSSLPGTIDFGVSGYCVTNATIPTGQCHTDFSFTLDKDITDTLGVSDAMQNVIPLYWKVSTCFHIVACISTFISFILTLLIFLKQHRGLRLTLTKVFSFISASATTIAFLGDFSIVATIDGRAHDLSSGFLIASYGKVIWIVWTACALVILSIIPIFYGIASINKEQVPNDSESGEAEKAEKSPASRPSDCSSTLNDSVHDGKPQYGDKERLPVHWIKTEPYNGSDYGSYLGSDPHEGSDIRHGWNPNEGWNPNNGKNPCHKY